MPSNLKFPSSVEIKRVIAAASRAGIEIGSIEIHPRKITIHAKKEDDETPESAYDKWKMREGRGTALVRQTDKQSGAQRRKSNDSRGAVVNSRVNRRFSCKPKTPFQASALDAKPLKIKEKWRARKDSNL